MDPRTPTLKLLDYCRSRNWAGHDPYDALNSRLFEAVPALDSRWPRLILTQALKRSPFDLRGLLRIPPTQNAKGISLFLRSLLKLSQAGVIQEPALIREMAELLVSMRSPGTPQWCWGYSFPWQTRTIVVPRGAPNVVCTIFVANALLDLHAETGDPRWVGIALSAAQYVEGLMWDDGNGTVSLSYPLNTVRSQIHNANLLGAALLSRVAQVSGERRFLDSAIRLARCAVARQRPDGSWPYGELAKQEWIDNFHTGYNLDGLRTIQRTSGTTEFEGALSKGFDFYRNHFIREDGAARYFHDRTHPIDAHCVAQTILTLLQFEDLDRTGPQTAQRVFEWAMENMWDERGFFYYRVLPACTIRTSYMRWVQAWMLLALSTLVHHNVCGAPAAARQATLAGSQP